MDKLLIYLGSRSLAALWIYSYGFLAEKHYFASCSFKKRNTYIYMSVCINKYMIRKCMWKKHGFPLERMWEKMDRTFIRDHLFLFSSFSICNDIWNIFSFFLFSLLYDTKNTFLWFSLLNLFPCLKIRQHLFLYGKENVFLFRIVSYPSPPCLLIYCFPILPPLHSLYYKDPTCGFFYGLLAAKSVVSFGCSGVLWELSFIYQHLNFINKNNKRKSIKVVRVIIILHLVYIFLHLELINYSIRIVL